MSLDQIRAEIETMSVQEQDKIAAYLVHLRHLRQPELARDLAHRLDDRTPANWVTLQDLQKNWKD